MYLERLEVSNVRNLSSVQIELSAGLNMLVGPNGSGKTALLEAVHVLSRGRSFRTRSTASVIRHDNDALTVRGVLQDEHRGRLSAAISKRYNNQTELKINGELEKRLSEVAGLLPIQLLLPNAADIIFSGPGARRQFIDWGAFHVKPSYLPTLRDYQKVVKQRNALLRQMNGKNARAELETWTARLVLLAEQVTSLREGYLGALKEPFNVALEALDEELDLHLGYNQGWRSGLSFADATKESTERDLALGSTQCGPHRADIVVKTGRGVDAASELSRGQAKTVAHAMSLAQAKLTESSVGRRSLFLIDDVGAELDIQHSERFFSLLSGLDCQVIATSTLKPALVKSFSGERQKTFHVEQGSCYETDAEN